MLYIGLVAALSFSPGFSGCPAAGRASAPRMAASIKISGDKIEITDAMREHAEAKLGVPIEKFSTVISDASPVEVIMKCEPRSASGDRDHAGRTAHVAEVTLRTNGGEVMRVGCESDDMYATIDDLEGRLATKLRKFKEKRSDVKIGRKAKGKSDMNAEDDGDDDFEDVPAPMPNARLEADLAAAAPAPAGFEWGGDY